MPARPEAVTRSRLVADLRRLGVRPGAIAMVHTRMSAIGWVVGAAETVVRALHHAEAIARAALAAGIGVRGRVGRAESHLFPARELTAFAVAWLEERFGAGGADPGAPPAA
jgi:aminoglycoside N3'-acetyltransferase